MAMTSCDECGKEISTTAKACPNCGAEKSRSKIGCLTYVFAGVAILLILAIIGNMSNQSTSGSSSISGTSSALSDAQAVCDAMRSTDIALQCTVRSSQKTINLIINTNANEARKMCAGVREEFRPYTTQLGNWVLRIYSPLDTSNHIASCAL